MLLSVLHCLSYGDKCWEKHKAGELERREGGEIAKSHYGVKVSPVPASVGGLILDEKHLELHFCLFLFRL